MYLTAYVARTVATAFMCVVSPCFLVLGMRESLVRRLVETGGRDLASNKGTDALPR